MANDWDDDDVGYGRPPRWTRFEKGQSGNPKGRPKKQAAPKLTTDVLPESQADIALRRELDRKIRITDASGTKEETMADAVARAQVTKAAQGHVQAMRDVRRAQKELERAEAERARLAAEQAEDERRAEAEQREAMFKFMQMLKADQAASWAAAIREGKAEPDNPWPHPDDINLDPVRRSVSTRGPILAKQLPEYEYLRAMRDRYFLESLLAVRTRDSAERAGTRHAAVLLGIYDALLPQRWAIGDDYMCLAEMFQAKPLRVLRRDLERAQRKADLLRPPQYDGSIRRSDAYQLVNLIMKPFLKPMGYASYAQFERAWEDSAGNPPWPRAGGSAASREAFGISSDSGHT